MKPTLISLMLAGLLAVVGTSAMAQNVTADDQKAAADANKPSVSTTAKSTANADYTAAKAKAASDYKYAKGKCDSMTGDAMRTCVSDAKSARTNALAMAETNWKNHK